MQCARTAFNVQAAGSSVGKKNSEKFLQKFQIRPAFPLIYKEIQDLIDISWPALQSV